METLLVALSFVSLFCLITPSSAVAFDKDDLIDLTWGIEDQNSMGWPEFPYRYEKLTMFDGYFAENIWVEAYGMKSAVHTGTHMDIGCHFNHNNGQRSHNVTFDQLFGPAIVIDVRDKVKDNGDYEMPLQEVHDWEKQHGTIPDRAIVLVNTGWSRHFGNMSAYYGKANANDSNDYAYPGVRHEAATFLVNERNINVLGIDTGSPDSGISTRIEADWWKVHIAVLTKNRLIFENVANLNLLPPTGYDIRAMPLKLVDTCGAPMRLIALKTPTAGAARPLVELMMVLVVMVTGWMLKP